uniref:Zinc transporter ZIP4 N-terminal domain-containing protein n=1 Tax=Octopus bimaculoides TaxID=37653 RepID=A0A0L8FY16_OCTBM
MKRSRQFIKIWFFIFQCFTAKEILGIVQLNSSSDVITREEFSNFSLVLLYHLQNVSNDCQSPGGSFINYQTKMMHLLTEDSKTISKIKVDLFLHKLLNLGHQDDDDHDNEDHARDGHGEHSKDSDDGHNDHDSDDDDDDDHDDHDHDGNGHDDDDHDDDGNGHDDDDHDDDGNGHDNHDHDDDGTYGFYLLEVGFTVVTKESEHSHDLPKDTKLSEVYTTTNEKNNSLENPKSMAEPNIPEKPNKCSSLSLIVILGDALHNFADGLTIGAAFSTSESFGLMTSIAVLCHEIPHELGDFAVLLANGIGFKRALLFNFVSSLTAFVGLFIGLGVSTDFIVRRWIYAVSAGMFLYIAFVDLFPVMKKHKTVKSLVSLFSNAGLILGVIIITLLGFYEEKIVGH